MSPELKAKGHKCERCGKVFNSVMRLQHHRAAEHATRTSTDIHIMRDIRHSKQSKPLRRPLIRG